MYERPPPAERTRANEPTAPGFIQGQLYVGERYTSFGAHVEVYMFASANYCWAGGPKVWYVVHVDDRDRFMKLLKEQYQDPDGKS